MEDRTRLEDLVEIDETDIPFRTRDEPREGGQARSPIGKMHVAGAVELSPDGSRPRRIRLAPIADFSSRSLHPFVAEVAAPGSRSGHRRMAGPFGPQIAANTPGRLSATGPPIW